jgi:hypothetical protein
MSKQLELVERYQNIVNTQLQLIERCGVAGNGTEGSKKKLESQLGNMVEKLGKATTKMVEKVEKKD